VPGAGVTVSGSVGQEKDDFGLGFGTERRHCW
jgi:hypothetical protein